MYIKDSYQNIFNKRKTHASFSVIPFSMQILFFCTKYNIKNSKILNLILNLTLYLTA